MPRNEPESAPRPCDTVVARAIDAACQPDGAAPHVEGDAGLNPTARNAAILPGSHRTVAHGIAGAAAYDTTVDVEAASAPDFDTVDRSGSFRTVVHRGRTCREVGAAG